MCNLDEPLARFSAHPLRRRVGGYQLRMSGLKSFELVHQTIEFRVDNFRIIEYVVAVLVMSDLFP